MQGAEDFGGGVINSSEDGVQACSHSTVVGSSASFGSTSLFSATETLRSSDERLLTENAEIFSNNSADDMPELSFLKESSSISPTNKSTLRVSMKSLIQMYKVFGGMVCSDYLRTFVEKFTNTIVGESGQGDGPHPSSFIPVESFSCPSCYGVWVEPITLSCGHSYCRKCLIKFAPGEMCKKCVYTVTRSDISQSKVDVLTASLVEKCWPKSVKTSLLRAEGNRLFEGRILQEAFWKYSEAIRLSPDDHISWGNRSHVQLMLGRSEAALLDAEKAIELCPVWSKGYFRKASALFKVQNYDEAFVNITLCLYILKSTLSTDLSVLSSVKNEYFRIIHKIFLQSFENIATDHRHSVDQLLFSPYPKPQSHFELLNGEDAVMQTMPSHSESCECTGNVRKMREKRSYSLEYKINPYTPSKEIHGTKHTEDNYRHFKLRIHRLFVNTSVALGKIHEEISKLRGEMNFLSGKGVSNIPSRKIEVATLSASDLECSLCYRLFYEPVVTHCGHTYCRTCLERSLDHSPDCPLCKTSLFHCLAHRQFCVTEFVDKIISRCLPSEKEERLSQHLEEIAQNAPPGTAHDIEMPIFVCTMAFPTVPCPLHVFEPRYRLMIRRAMESGTRRFGMCCYMQDAEGNYADYGTVLEVANVQYFPDGRSVIDTIGVKRFKISKKSIKDGYNTAIVEYLVDRTLDPDERSKLITTHANVYEAASNWLNSINQVLKQRITTHFGNIPTPEDNWMEIPDGPSWMWWLLAILPLDSKAQLAILSMNSLQKRLDSILKVLNYVKNTGI